MYIRLKEVGALCIVLVYRLFALGYGEAAKGSSAEAKLGKASLSLKNAAPGTVFALFGAALLVCLLLNDPPAFTHQADGATITARNGDAWGGLDAEARKVIADELHRNAHAYRQQQQLPQALRLADYATRFDPDDANLWDTLASLYATKGAYPQAAQAMHKALQLAPGKDCYVTRLQQFASGKAAADCP